MTQSNDFPLMSYQKMLEYLDSVETERVIHQRLASVDRGEPGVPAKEVLADTRKRLGVERKWFRSDRPSNDRSQS